MVNGSNLINYVFTISIILICSISLSYSQCQIDTLYSYTQRRLPGSNPSLQLSGDTIVWSYFDSLTQTEQIAILENDSLNLISTLFGNTTTCNKNPFIHNGNIFWIADAEKSSKIYRYNGKSIDQISPPEALAIGDIEATKGSIVWSGRHQDFETEIFQYYNDSVIITSQSGVPTYSNRNPKTDGKGVIWKGFNNGRATLIYNRGSEKTDLSDFFTSLNISFRRSQYDIYDGTVVFTITDIDSEIIRLYSLKGSTLKLLDKSEGLNNPSLLDNRVTYMISSLLDDKVQIVSLNLETMDKNSTLVEPSLGFVGRKTVAKDSFFVVKTFDSNFQNISFYSQDTAIIFNGRMDGYFVEVSEPSIDGNDVYWTMREIANVPLGTCCMNEIISFLRYTCPALDNEPPSLKKIPTISTWFSIVLFLMILILGGTMIKRDLGVSEISN